MSADEVSDLLAVGISCAYGGGYVRDAFRSSVDGETVGRAAGGEWKVHRVRREAKWNNVFLFVQMSDGMAYPSTSVPYASEHPDCLEEDADSHGGHNRVVSFVAALKPRLIVRFPAISPRAVSMDAI
ncbi:hypothetical protein QQ045_019406 [Rhodiola kirilowii]